MSSGGYDFSQLYHSSVVAYSPGSSFLATIHGNRLIVRSTATLAVVRSFQCLKEADPSASSATPRVFDESSKQSIDQISWSNDSLYLLAYSAKAATAWIFGLTDEGNGQGGEVARLGGEGIEGLARVEWGRGDREVLAWSDLGLRLTIYDLTSGKASYVQYPKHSTNGHAYSPDSRYLAVIERHNSKDFVGIYDTSAQYGLLRHFALSTTDAQAISWSPCVRFIAVSESLLSYGLFIHSPLGPLLNSFSYTSASFSSSSTSEDPGLGVRCMTWAPTGDWIALGGWDGKIRVVESEAGRCMGIVGYAARTVEAGTVTWREPADWLKDTRGRGIVQFDRSTSNSPMPTVRADLTKAPPRSGISVVAFDAEATLFFSRLETQPNVVHIHTFLPTPTSSSPDIRHIAALIFTEPIKAARWCPGKRKLAISTRTGSVYFWDGEDGWIDDGDMTGGFSENKGGMAEGTGIPAKTEFAASDVVWAPDGASLAILDKQRSQFCVLYEPDAEEEGGNQSASGRWDGEEGLTHVSEEEELEYGEAERSSLSILAEAEAHWASNRSSAVTTY